MARDKLPRRNPQSSGPQLLFADHHGQIDAAAADLKVAIYGDDPHIMVACYRAFERAIVEHLAAEEEEILPAYADHDPEDAYLIREQHAELRRQLYHIAVDVEIHSARAETVESVVDSLRVHAAHEEARMYAWAELHLPLGTKRHLFLRIGQSIRDLVRFRARFARARELAAKEPSIH